MSFTRITFQYGWAGALVLLLSIGLGCKSPDADTAPAGGDQVRERSVESPTAEIPEIVTIAASIAKRIDANPDDIEAILAEHDLDVERFEEMMYEISSDPKLSEAYAAALE